MHTDRPLVSFGLPIRNGSKYIEASLRSILAQDYPDIEVVISDNASTDDTVEIIRAIGRDDPRVKLFPNEVNIGQNPNFNRVLELAQGEYFRWTGMDDSFDPTYVSRCVAELERHPESIGVSTYILYVGDDGTEYYAEYSGERLESPLAHRRFARALWFLYNDYRYADAVYTMYRREALLASPRLRIVTRPDQLLSLDLALMGPSRHVPACLATRRREPTHYMQALGDVYQPGAGAIVDGGHMDFARFAYASVREAGLNGVGRSHCVAALSKFLAVTSARRADQALRRSIPRPVKTVLKRALGRA